MLCEHGQSSNGIGSAHRIDRNLPWQCTALTMVENGDDMLGILGGMGPMATVDFLDKLVRETRATRDQDHLSFILASLPKIPDRTEALLGAGPSPLSALLNGLDRLLAAGADAIAIPCNTAHAWFDELSTYAGIPMLHIAETVVSELLEAGIDCGEIGLLATDGTLAADVYQTLLHENGFECRLPLAQDQVMAGIRAVKFGDALGAQLLLANQARLLLASGCRTVILGCTEIPVALAGLHDLEDRVIDASLTLARAALRQQGIPVR